MSEGQILQTLLEKYQVRKNQRQKADFFRFAQAVCHSAGYLCEIEEAGKRTVSRNIIAGNPETARVIFTAHYDTCAEMPLPNLAFPRSRLKTFLAQMPLILLMMAASFVAGRLVSLFAPFGAVMLTAYAVYFGLLRLFFFGPANPHTANDNTSGVAALMAVMAALPAEKRADAAFIFFDNEERGKVGSKAYAKAHPGITEGKVLLNLDCVGDGDDFLVMQPKDADEALAALLRAAFQDGEGKRAVHCPAKTTHYNSDQKSFPNGVAVAACRKGRLGYYISRIHTRRDVICEESNLRYLRDCALRLMEQVQ